MTEKSLQSTQPLSIPRRRWKTFKANRRGYWSFWILLVCFILSLGAEFIANDRPILVKYKGEYLFPIFRTYTETGTFGGVLESEADYNDPWVTHEINRHGWMIKPPIPYNYTSINFDI
ncbi:MAG: ABC transporter permease, partial [Alphaproteobacteria bacterium]